MEEMRIGFLISGLLTLAALSLSAQTEAPDSPPPAIPLPIAASAEKGAAATPPATLTNDQIKDLIRKVAENDLENDKRLRDYTYIEREETRKHSKSGAVSSTESKTYDVLQIYGETVQKLVAKNDQPLSAKEAQKEDEKLQKIIDKRKNESDSDREKRIRKEEKDREEGREFVKEIADAYDFSLVGVDPIDGRPAWVIDATPRPGFVPHRKEAKFLSKIVGRVWIDQLENQLVKIDARITDTISFGLFLARLHEGTRIIYEQARVNDEVWLPRHSAVHVDIRVALLKNFDADIDVTDRDYKKFHTGTRVVGMEEIKDKP
jgi:hypothetical protein